MALIDKASLLMVPSTYEAGKLYNVLPSGNRAPDSTDQNSGYDQTRADFDFDRGSNAAASRINSSGLIEKYRENLLTYSNTFDQWDDTTIVLTSGQSGYDGSSDAWLMAKNGTNSRVFRGVTTSGVTTTSIYAKANASNYLRLRLDTTNATSNTYFDLSNGTIYSTNASIDTKIESVGNGWYRCSVVPNDPTTIVRLYPSEAGSTASATGSIFIQSAQLESGLVATDVLTSGATTGKAGVLVDLPRINYDANGENGSLLLEPSRQQLIQYSEWFGTWSIAQMSIENNFATSPEGIKNATRLIENTAGGTAHSVNISTQTTQTEHAFSVYVKPNGRNYIYMYVGGGPGQGTIIDIVNGTKGNNVGNAPNDTIIEPVGNGWFRCTILFNGIAGTPTPTIGLAYSSSSFTYTGDGTSGVLIYAAQCEAGSYATSYIPNHGESGGVTRAADSCSVTGASDVIGQTEGTLFVEAETLENGADCRITLSDNTIYNRVSIEWDANADTIKGFIGVGGNVESTNHNQTNRNKIAIVYNSSDARFFINGTKVMTDTSVPSLSGMDRIEFSNFSGPLPFVGKVYKMYVSKEKLTDAECETLTTL